MNGIQNEIEISSGQNIFKCSERNLRRLFYIYAVLMLKYFSNISNHFPIFSMYLNIK